VAAKVEVVRKSVGPKGLCRFESGRPHQIYFVFFELKVSAVAKASAYVLNVKPDRRETLLTGSDSHSGDVIAAEPVPLFNHSRRSPLVVLASFENNTLTHVGNARKGAPAGTDLVRLNLTSLHRLRRPISFSEILRAMPTNLRGYLERAFESGGLIPPKTVRAVVDVLGEMDPDLREMLDRLSASRADMIAGLGTRARENLALQKETLATALAIAGVQAEEILAWSPSTEEPTSFLDGLPGARVREDVMLYADISSLPGFSILKDAPHIAARTFQSVDQQTRVTVVMANRLPLEEQTGADLIYFNETFRSFVLVQYKALEKVTDEPEFRWTEGDQFTTELLRMDKLLETLNEAEADNNPDGFRLTTNPFFLKFCSRVVFNPDDKGMFPGIYLPHGLWKALAGSDRLKGPRGGNLLTGKNVGRRMNSPEFVMLVAGSWVGTTMKQSESLDALFKSILETGRTVTFAIKRGPDPDPDGIQVTEPFLNEGTAVDPEEGLVKVLS
jgi:hypothetical protein